MGILDFLFGKKKMTLADAAEENRAFGAANPAPKNDEDAMMRKASGWMTGGKFADSAELYLEMAEKFPSNRGLYLGQAGAAYYFMSDFNTAISYYLQARQEGASEGMMDDNVWEACEAIYNAGGRAAKAALERYLAHFPNGSYSNRAQKMLAK